MVTLWLVACADPLWAALTGVTETIPVAPYTGAETEIRMPIAIQTNHATGDYVVCWGTRGSGSAATMHCTRFDNSNTALATGTVDTTLSGGISDASIEAAVNDQGQFFIAWTDDGADSYLAGFDDDGTALFAAQQITGDWIQIGMAVTPDFLWVGGYSYVTSPAEVSTLEVYLYDPGTGSSLSHSVFFQENTVTATCRTSDLASTTSGDVLLTWVRGTACEGTVWARTFLQNGTPITDEIQLSQPITNQNLNIEPRAVAHDNGEYVVTWFNKTTDMLWSAALTFGGTVAVPQTSLIPAQEATPFTAAGFPQNRDFIAVASMDSPNPDCTLASRLLFSGDLIPEANIPLGLCTLGFDIAFRQDGGLMLSRFSNPQVGEAGQVEVAIFPRPAEIDVSPVSVTEGDPQRGIGNYATLTTSLSSPHPLGEDITVNYFTRDNTAFAGLDYQQTSDTATFNGMSGQTAQVIQIPIVVDTIYEANELFSVNLANASNAVLRKGGETALVTILNDDMTPPILPDCDAGDPTQCRQIQEMGPGQFTHTLITLTMAESVDLPVSVNFATQQGGIDPTRFATPGSDYVDVSGTLQFPAGTTEASFTLTVIGDDVPEDTETFQVALSAGNFINLPQATLTFGILDDTLCFLQLDPDQLVYEMGGGSMPVQLTTLDNTCQWSGMADQPWVSLDPATGSDTQTIQVTADAWAPMGQVSRSAEVTLELTGGNGMGTATLSIEQDGDCNFSTDVDSANFPADGGDGSIMVTASDPSCAWSVSSGVSWLNIVSPTSDVTGSGEVHYSVSANASVNVENSPRMTTLVSGEFDFMVTQDGCVYDVAPGMVPVAAGGNDAVDVNVMAGPSVCQWTAVSNSVWIIVESGASGGGSGTVGLDVLENPSVVPRVGSVSIADEMVTVNQDGQPCAFDASPASLDFCPDGDSFEIDVTATAGCDWSLMETEDWISILSNPAGDGNEVATGLVGANLSQTPRTSTIELISMESGMSAADVQIQQQGFLEYEPFDGPLPSDWSFDPPGAFSVAGGLLHAALSGGGMGSAIHQNLKGTCSDCKIETTMEVTSVTSQSQEVATLAGWYMSENEFVGFGMDEFANTWKLYQVSGGSVVASNSMMVPQILPNQPYHVAIRYDGTTFHGFVDGAEVVAVSQQPGTDPFGFAGLMANGSNAQFTELRVTGVYRNSDILHLHSFEDPLLLLSACTQD